MTSKKHAIANWPIPLKTKDGALGDIARELVKETQETHNEATAFARVHILTGRRPPMRRLARLATALAVASVLAGGGTLLYQRISHARRPGVAAGPSLVRSRPEPSERRVNGPAPAEPPSSRTIPSTPKRAAVRLAGAPVSLPSGPVDLVGQATMVLAADAVATGQMHADSAEIVLKKGQIDLDVLPRAPGHGFSVRARNYRFTVVGTSFTVIHTRSRLELLVREGTVAVWRINARVAMVHAGQTWETELAPTGGPPVAAPDPAPSGLPTPATSVPPSVLVPSPAFVPPLASPPASQPADVAGRAVGSLPAVITPGKPSANPPTPTAIPCADWVANRKSYEALTCYQEKARQGGLVGETAQYELARLLRDSFGDARRALASFQEQRERFPSGALRIEADLSIMEILPRLGRHGEALAETERFLVTHPRFERRGEIHRLRGNIFREGLHDLRQAEREYALGADSGGRTGDDCRFLHAVCMEALGRTKEARTEYVAYLRQRAGAHWVEAKKRLDALGE